MCRYEIPEHKEVPLRYTGVYQPISNTGMCVYVYIIE
jgi:hypothetical protein